MPVPAFCTVRKAQTLARGHRSALLNPFSSPLAANPPWAIPSKTPGAMFLKSNNYEANSYQRRVPCPNEPRSRKTGTGSPFPHQHSHSNNHPVKAETGCLSQRFAPSEKPKPSPETTVPPFSTRFHPRCGGPAVGVHKSLKKFLDPISPSQATVCSTLAP